MIKRHGRWIALALFGLGAIVFTLLEITIPGLILLLGAFLIGVYTIASPEQLGERSEPAAGAGDGTAADPPPAP